MALFEYENGLQFLHATLELSFLDFAGNISDGSNLTSTILGYVCFLMFSLLEWNNIRQKFTMSVFTCLALFGFFFELNTFFQAWRGAFQGAHCRIGIALFFFGLYITLGKSSSKIPELV